MRQVICTECNKRYNFDTDDFCPRCGAFNPPKKKWGIDAAGNVVRVDGLNESNHTGSFVHKEVHSEKAARRAKGLDRDPVTSAKKISAQPVKLVKPAPVKVKLNPSLGGAAERAEKKKKSNIGAIVGAILALFALLMEIIS